MTTITARPLDPRRQIVPVVALTAEEIIEDLTDLASHGVGMVEAAHRVGKSAAACEQFLYRHNRHDLITMLWAQNRGLPDTPIRARKRTARQHYAQAHGAWAQQVRDDAAALLAALTPDDPELVAARRRELEAAWSA